MQVRHLVIVCTLDSASFPYLSLVVLCLSHKYVLFEYESNSISRLQCRQKRNQNLHPCCDGVPARVCHWCCWYWGGRKKRQPLSLITFDLDRVHCVCVPRLYCIQGTKTCHTLAYYSECVCENRTQVGGICIWLHSSHCERWQLLRYRRVLIDGAWLNLMGHCRFHRLFQGPQKSPFHLPFDEALGQ